MAGVLMTVALRQIQRDDYITCFTTARDSRAHLPHIGGEERWRWMIPGLRALTDGPSGGVTASLDEAKAAFRWAWDARV